MKRRVKVSLSVLTGSPKTSSTFQWKEEWKSVQPSSFAVALIASSFNEKKSESKVSTLTAIRAPHNPTCFNEKKSESRNFRRDSRYLQNPCFNEKKSESQPLSTLAPCDRQEPVSMKRRVKVKASKYSLCSLLTFAFQRKEEWKSGVIPLFSISAICLSVSMKRRVKDYERRLAFFQDSPHSFQWKEEWKPFL